MPLTGITPFAFKMDKGAQQTWLINYSSLLLPN